MLFKPSHPLQKAKKRLALTTKNAAVGGGYYKGTGVGSMGWHTKHGGYIVDLRKVRTYVAPKDLDDQSGLWPFVPVEHNSKSSKAAAYQENQRRLSQYSSELKRIKNTRAEAQKKGIHQDTSFEMEKERLDEKYPRKESSRIGGLDGERYLQLARAARRREQQLEDEKSLPSHLR